MSNEILIIVLWGGLDVTIKCGNWGSGKANDLLMLLNIKVKIITKSLIHGFFICFSKLLLLWPLLNPTPVNDWKHFIDKENWLQYVFLNWNSDPLGVVFTWRDCKAKFYISQTSLQLLFFIQTQFSQLEVLRTYFRRQ